MMLETRLARVPQQLVSPDGEQSGTTDDNEEAEDVKEFSGAGAAAGFTLPLGMSPTSIDSQKKPSRRNHRKT